MMVHVDVDDQLESVRNHIERGCRGKHLRPSSIPARPRGVVSEEGLEEQQVDGAEQLEKLKQGQGMPKQVDLALLFSRILQIVRKQPVSFKIEVRSDQSSESQPLEQKRKSQQP